ncbi:MAG: zinc-dependent metalloprotease [Phycisphaerales bacterium]|nr:zinc-dependent metalloprotease [Phycisphaerales bacterium]
MYLNRTWRILPVALVLAGLTFAPSAIAQEKKAPEEKKKEKPEFPPFDETMKDFKEVPTSDTPMFSLYHNKKTDSLRAVIPGSMIGKQFLIASSISGGPAATGFQLDHFLAYFDRMDKNLVLMRVDPRYVLDGDKPITDVVKRSYGSDFIMQKIPIITMNGGDPVIDLDDLFKGDFSGISGMGAGSINSDLSKWAEFKPFKENVELSVDLAMMGRDGGKRMLVHYSLSQIPDSAKGYKPRVADDRVGYFMTARMDWMKDYKADTMFDRYIERWRLEKRDPSLEFSAPKDPIVWYIEKTVPLQYRRWVKEGILEWNKAFEKCGILDAIEVVQQEEDRFGDYDPEDVRYNFFRWIVTGRGFAMGPSRAHPLTGQIFDADIVMDDAMARIYVNRYDLLTGDESSWAPYDPYMQAFFDANPRYKFKTPRELLLPNLRLSTDPNAEFLANLQRRMQERGQPVCECASGMAHQAQFASLAMEAKGIGRDSEEFMGQIIKEVVMHEVGHCLGLRHNFKASTWLSMDEILKSKNANEACVGSVMDYNPAIVAPRGQEQGSFVTRTIGPYDYWAIEYGYRNVGKPYKDEEEMLSKIGSRAAEPGLAYSTDEDTFGSISPDPLSNRFDMGSDVMAYAKQQIELSESLLKDVTKWAVKDGESYNKLRRAVISILSQKARATSFVARFPGGIDVSRTHKGDTDEKTPMMPTDPKLQRKALQFVCDNVFAEDAYKIDPDLLNHLAAGRFSHWGSDEFDFFVEFNVHDFVASAQNQCLFAMINPFTIGRIHDNQVKYSGDDVYSLGEHMTALTDAIWSELNESDRKGTESKPLINSFRRNLQRQHLDELMNLVLSEPGGIVPADANAIARLSVSDLSKKIGKRLGAGDIDIASRAHLADIKTRIDKALEAQYTVDRYGAMGGIFFFRPTEKSTSTLTVLPQN